MRGGRSSFERMITSTCNLPYIYLWTPKNPGNEYSNNPFSGANCFNSRRVSFKLKRWVNKPLKSGGKLWVPMELVMLYVKKYPMKFDTTEYPNKFLKQKQAGIYVAGIDRSTDCFWQTVSLANGFGDFWDHCGKPESCWQEDCETEEGTNLMHTISDQPTCRPTNMQTNQPPTRSAGVPVRGMHDEVECGAPKKLQIDPKGKACFRTMFF